MSYESYSLTFLDLLRLLTLSKEQRLLLVDFIDMFADKFFKTFQRCPPLSGVEGSVESQLRVLGERERWNIDVLLRMLIELLPFVHQKAIETCPLTSTETSLSSGPSDTFFSVSLLQLYARCV